MTNALLKISALDVEFFSAAGNKKVVDNLSLQLLPGETCALVGESGSGKSVTAHAVINLLEHSGKKTGGEIWLDAEPLHLKTEQEMQRIRGKKIGMIFQDPMSSLNPTLKIGWQIAESMVAHEGSSWREAKQRALDLLRQVEIADPASAFHAYPFQMSGGMLQRVMIACALSCSPSLLIADEPTTSLDVTIQAEILALLRKIQLETHMGLLLITHDLSIVWGLCDRVAVMQKGQIVECGCVHTVFTNPQHPYTSLLLSALPEEHLCPL